MAGIEPPPSGRSSSELQPENYLNPTVQHPNAAWKKSDTFWMSWELRYALSWLDKVQIFNRDYTPGIGICVTVDKLYLFRLALKVCAVIISHYSWLYRYRLGGVNAGRKGGSREADQSSGASAREAGACFTGIPFVSLRLILRDSMSVKEFHAVQTWDWFIRLLSVKRRWRTRFFNGFFSQFCCIMMKKNILYLYTLFTH